MEMERINLQLFAEEEEPAEEPEEEVKEPEEAPEEPTEEPTEEEPLEEEPAKEPSKDTIPLAKYMEERKRRQQLERMLADQEAEREKLKAVQEYIERGYPEYEAQNLAQRDIEQKREIEELRNWRLEESIKELSRSDPFFSDAEAFKDEIKTKMKELKCDAATAYMTIRGPARMKEYQTEQEQRNLVKRRTVEGKKVTNATPTPIKSEFELDEYDKKALAGLQKLMPDAGWTAKKYFELMKKKE